MYIEEDIANLVSFEKMVSTLQWMVLRNRIRLTNKLNCAGTFSLQVHV